MSIPLDLAKITPLMKHVRGRPEIIVGLIDGPVAMDHPGLEPENIREISGRSKGKCDRAHSSACQHGTFVAGILKGKRDSGAPAICPGCTLLVRPIFKETTPIGRKIPSASPGELAAAVIDCIEAGARLLNLSVALSQPSLPGERQLAEALDYAAQRGVIPVAAAGNQGSVGGSVITSHPWVIPVVACDLHGRPLDSSNLGSSIGRRGFAAPGKNITSLGANGSPLTLSGTSVATPLVTGAIALLWSGFPAATSAQIKFALNHASLPRRSSIVPPLINAWGAYQAIWERRS